MRRHRSLITRASASTGLRVILCVVILALVSACGPGAGVASDPEDGSFTMSFTLGAETPGAEITYNGAQNIGSETHFRVQTNASSAGEKQTELSISYDVTRWKGSNSAVCRLIGCFESMDATWGSVITFPQRVQDGDGTYTKPGISHETGWRYRMQAVVNNCAFHGTFTSRDCIVNFDNSVANTSTNFIYTVCPCGLTEEDGAA